MKTTSLVDAAVAAFQASTGLVARRLGPANAPAVEVVAPEGARRFAVRARPHVHRTGVSHAAALERGATRSLLVTEQLSSQLAELCRDHDQPFIDTAGNAYLNEPGLFVYVNQSGTARKDKTKSSPTASRAFREHGLRIIYSCVVIPGLLQSTYREIARASGAALGTVSGTLSDLKTHGFLADLKGRRHWTDRQRLMQAWMVNYPLALRPKLNPRRFRANTPNWMASADPLPPGLQWGGEMAASKLEAELVPITATVYARSSVAQFARTARLVADPDGPIEVLDTFWEATEQDTDIVSPLLVCADLLYYGDPRTVAAARMLHERYLA